MSGPKLGVSRVAGLAMLAYYATALSDMWLFARTSAGGDVATRLVHLSARIPTVELTIVLELLTVICALALAVTLYALTRQVSGSIALMAFSCRLTEGILNTVSPAARIALLSLLRKSASIDPAAREVQASLLLRAGGWAGAISGPVFAVGSALFAYLLARGRVIPAAIAWVGLFGSVVVLPVYLASSFGMISGSGVWIASIPLIAFELTLGLWLVTRGGQHNFEEQHDTR